MPQRHQRRVNGQSNMLKGASADTSGRACRRLGLAAATWSGAATDRREVVRDRRGIDGGPATERRSVRHERQQRSVRLGHELCGQDDTQRHRPSPLAYEDSAYADARGPNTKYGDLEGRSAAGDGQLGDAGSQTFHLSICVRM